MTEQSTFDRTAIVFFRLTMAWTFLYAASHQVFDPKWTVVGFLSRTKTFHDVFVVFTTPTMAPITTCLPHTRAASSSDGMRAWPMPRARRSARTDGNT